MLIGPWKTGSESYGQTRQVLYWDIKEVQLGFGVLQKKGTTRHVLEGVEREPLSLCDGHAFHMIRKVLIIYGSLKRQRRRKQPRKLLIDSIRSWNLKQEKTEK